MLRLPLPVNVAPVSYADNKHQNTFSSKLLENPVVAHAEAVSWSSRSDGAIPRLG